MVKKKHDTHDIASATDAPNEHGEAPADVAAPSSERCWTLRQKTKGSVWYFRAGRGLGGEERTTGTKDRAEAEAIGSRFAAELAAGGIEPRTPDRPPVGIQRQRRAAVSFAAISFAAAVASWIGSLRHSHAQNTRESWAGYATAHWVRYFTTAAGEFTVTAELCVEYMRDRLGKVLAHTVKGELTALRSFVTYCRDEGHLSCGPEVVPVVPKRAQGTPHHQRRRVAAFELSPEQVRAVLRALPEWSRTGFAVRARFLVQYETGLRPSTLDRLLVPKHYRAGSNVLRLSADTDKARWARDVPLTRRARRVLDYLLKAYARRDRRTHSGPLFGPHDHRCYIGEAARRALPPELADRFCAAHLRSARITHLLERPQASLPGVQHLVGHKQTSTTARYVKPSFRAALDALGERS